MLLSAMRALSITGRKALPAIEWVHQGFNDPDAGIRRAVVLTAAFMAATHPGMIELFDKASADRSKVVRDTAAKCVQKAKTA